MLRGVALVRTDVSEELSASFIGVTRIGELGTTLAVTSNRRKVKASVPNDYMWSRDTHEPMLTNSVSWSRSCHLSPRRVSLALFHHKSHLA
jgi:hypothetical protein